MVCIVLHSNHKKMCKLIINRFTIQTQSRDSLSNRRCFFFLGWTCQLFFCWLTFSTWWKKHWRQQNMNETAKNYGKKTIINGENHWQGIKSFVCWSLRKLEYENINYRLQCLYCSFCVSMARRAHGVDMLAVLKQQPSSGRCLLFYLCRNVIDLSE